MPHQINKWNARIGKSDEFSLGNTGYEIKNEIKK